MAFQENLKMYREQAGYSSAKDFANLLGVPYTTYLGYESKGVEPKYELLIKMADILNVTPNTLLGVKDPKLTLEEQNLIKKYRALDERGKQTVDETLEREYKFANPLKINKDVG